MASICVNLNVLKVKNSMPKAIPSWQYSMNKAIYFEAWFLSFTYINRLYNQDVMQASLSEITEMKISYHSQTAAKQSDTDNYPVTHPGWDKMAAILQMTISNAFSWMKMFEFRLKFHWNLFPRVQLAIWQHWFRYWLSTDKATSHYLNQGWPSLLTRCFFHLASMS